jgi:hypothetical protein
VLVPIVMRSILSILLSLTLSACARYEYDLVEPPDLARHIGTKSDEVIELEPLVYHLRSYDNRLVMRIENATEDPIRLVGDRSYVVDPAGQSHPLRSLTAAPHSFIKLILPPPRPYYRSGSNIGFGIGVGVGHFHRHGFYGGGLYYPFYDPWFDEPRYYTLYEPGDATYWDWDGETDVKLKLVYQRGDRTFEDKFTFHRKKM